MLRCSASYMGVESCSKAELDTTATAARRDLVEHVTQSIGAIVPRTLHKMRTTQATGSLVTRSVQQLQV